MNSYLHFLTLIALIAHIRADCTKSATTVRGQTAELCSGDLIFDEEFDNLDLNRWQHEVTLSGCGNAEFEYYLNDRRNSFITNSELHIRPTFLTDDYPEDFLYSGTLDLGANCTDSDENSCVRTGTATNIINPIKSARIRTINSFSFTYGKASVRAKMPAGDWLWPAVWFLPTANKYGGWPASGEIDLLETRGNKNLVNTAGVNVGIEQASSTLHWGPTPDTNQFIRTHWEKNNNSGYHNDFRIYETVWNSDGFRFSIDGEEIGNLAVPAGGFWELGQFEGTGVENPWAGGTKMAPFDQDFHILINLAIGGNFFDDSFTNEGGKPWVKNAPTAMTDFWKGKAQWQNTWDFDNGNSDLVVDYVKIYAL